MGITSKKGKAPVALPTVSQCAMLGVNAPSKASRKAARRAAYERSQREAMNVDSKPALTTKGRIRANGGGVNILQNKSTAYKAVTTDRLVANVGGKLVTLGNRSTYSEEDRERIEREAQGYVKQTGAVYPDLTGAVAHMTRRPVTLSKQLEVKPATGKKSERKRLSIDEALAAYAQD